MFYGAQLVEPGAMYYYNKTLQSCHNLKETYYNIYNILLILGFILLFGGLLYIRYKGKLSPIEQKLKQNKKHEYIISKVRNYQDAKRQTTDAQLITKLPEYNNEYDLISENYMFNIYEQYRNQEENKHAPQNKFIDQINLYYEIKEKYKDEYDTKIKETSQRKEIRHAK